MEELSYSIKTSEGKVFFDLKVNVHSEYLKITQSKHLDNDTFQRNDIFIDKSELLLFKRAVDKAVDYWGLNTEPKEAILSSKSRSLDERRAEHEFAYKKWDAEADDLLGRLFDEGHSISKLAEMFERSVGSIRSRLKVIGKL